ncbi:MAG: hypothetical protein EAX90_02275 [Candidatus Heimdallarchaeota archaeon]|nr:hypothetical protein [Candidatus Heimdallarchaeota archaeon]
MITLSALSIVLAAYLVKKTMDKKNEKDTEKSSSNIEAFNIQRKIDQLFQEQLDIQKESSYLSEFDNQNY